MKPAVKRLIGVFGSLALLVGALTVFSVLILPATATIQELRGEKVALTNLYNNERRTVDAVGEVFEKFGSVFNLQDTLSLALPTQEDIPSIVNQINGIAKATGVIIDSIDLKLLPINVSSKDDAFKPVGTVRITIDLEGAYESIKLYLDSIETNVRIMDVQMFEVEGDTESEVLKYTIEIDAYYQT